MNIVHRFTFDLRRRRRAALVFRVTQRPRKMFVHHRSDVTRIMCEHDAVGGYVLCPAPRTRWAPRVFFVVIIFFKTPWTTWKFITALKNWQLWITIVSSNKTPTWCNTVQVLFLQSHSTCFGRQVPIIRSIKTGTAAPGTGVIVAGRSSHHHIRDETSFRP